MNTIRQLRAKQFAALVFVAVSLASGAFAADRSALDGEAKRAPLIFKAISYLIYGPLPEGQDVVLHPIAYAGWVGLLITALNLMPIGQLDGGHILYALLPRYAFAVSLTLLYGAVVATIFWRLWHWSLMLILLVLLVRHPPAAHEEVPIDRTRVVLGWLMLLFVLVGFTPTPWNL